MPHRALKAITAPGSKPIDTTLRALRFRAPGPRAYFTHFAHLSDQLDCKQKP